MKLNFEGSEPGKISIDEDTYFEEFSEKAQRYTPSYKELDTEFESLENISDELRGASGKIEMEDRSVLPMITEKDSIDDIGRFLEENSGDFETEFSAAAYDQRDNLIYGNVICHNMEDTEKTQIIPFLPFFTDVYRPLQFEFRRDQRGQYRIESQYLSPTELVLKNFVKD